MKKVFAIAMIGASAAISGGARGEVMGGAETANQDGAPVAATLREDGSTNTWTQADLQDALGLMNRKYWRDMQSDAGRRAWHGQRMGQFVLTNGTQLIRVDVYKDGYIATNTPTRARSRLLDPEAAAKAKAEAERQAAEARAAWERANLPPDLAALREAQRQAASTNEVTVSVEAN